MNKLTASRIRRTNGVSRFQNGISTTLAGLTCNISVVDGTAFVTNPSVDLTPYLGCRITLVDTAGLSLIGWVKAKGTGESLDAEKITNGNFSTGDLTGWTKNGSALSNEDFTGNKMKVTVTSTGTLIFRQGSAPSLLDGGLYKGGLVISESNLSAPRMVYLRLIDQNAYPVYNQYADGSYTGYVTKNSLYTNIGVGDSNINGYTAGNIFAVDDITLKQVLTPSATGVTITNSPGGSVFNWAAKHPSFNPNSATFNAIIRA